MYTARRTWISMAAGYRIPPTAMCGRREWQPDGRRIAKAAGFGWIITAGPGSATILGAGRRITTGAGIRVRPTAGAGIRAGLGSECVIIGVPPWWHSSDLATAAADSGSDTWAGCRSRRTSDFTPGMGVDSPADVAST